MHSRAIFWKPFENESVNEFQKLLKSAENYFFPAFSSFWAKLSERKLYLIRCEILGLLDNTLTPNYEYSCSNKENLPLPIQIKFFNKQSISCCTFSTFLVSTLNSQCFKTKMSVIRQILLKLLSPKDVII